MNPTEIFNDYLRRQGLNLTRQREAVLEAFLQAETHLSAEQLFERLKAQDARVGQTTIYRTLKLLVACGLAEERRFADHVSSFEPLVEHHEHLICTACGQIIEFEHEELERLKESIAASFGFRLQRHTLHLYGQCAGCQHKEAGHVPAVV